MSRATRLGLGSRGLVPACARAWLLIPALVFVLASWTAATGAETGGDCGGRFAKIGLPVHRGELDAEDFTLLCRTTYAALHNNKTKISDWVIEDLPRSQLSGTADRKKSRFKEDPDLKREDIPRATLKDYRGSGFDRGHQAPAADFKRSQAVMDESFYLSNMAPQIGPGFNRGIWARLEERVRDLVRSRKRLIVITGPVYESDELPPPKKNEIGDSEPGVRVPEGFYKIVYDPKRRRALAFLMPNQKLRKRKIGEFRTTVRELEELTGLNFFPALSRRTQNILEENVGEMWRW